MNVALTSGPRLRILRVGTLLLLLGAEPGLAQCTQLAPLARFHDAYRQVLSAPHASDPRLAYTLMAYATLTKKTFLESPSTEPLDIGDRKLERILRDANNLANSALSEIQTGEVPSVHEENVARIGRLLLGSGCFGTGQQDQSLSTVVFDPSAIGGRKDKVSTSRFPIQFGNLLSILAVLILAATTVFLASRSAFFRRKAAERMPRFQFSTTVRLTYSDSEGQRKTLLLDAVNISSGGIQLKWPSSCPSGTSVELAFLDTQRKANVVWSNNHFAGLVFENVLSDDELWSAIARSRGSSKTETAPEGAV